PLGVLLVSGLVTVLVWGWWVIRNMLTYGVRDPLALTINRIVVAQPLTGPITLTTVKNFATVTFHSFWAQFGWMGIPVPAVYPPLELLTLLAFAGTLVALVRFVEAHPGEWALSARGGEILLLVSWPLLVLASVVQYNLTFIQEQGRYLFPAIGGFGLCFMLGLSRLAGPRLSPFVLSAVSFLLFLLCIVLLRNVVIPAWHS
ncbi:MAG: hypothetical protein M1396_05540, partial [Chloroflexi bacterium]|nr:hypothetical protein [Chloroflexota bacterium]